MYLISEVHFQNTYVYGSIHRLKYGLPLITLIREYIIHYSANHYFLYFNESKIIIRKILDGI